MMSPRVMSSEYMHWAKTRASSRFNLATSGLLAYPICDPGVSLEDVAINGPNVYGDEPLYGYGPLQQALADKSNVTPDCVVAAAGTSFANHLAMAALVAPGDEVLMEHPAYEPLVSLARYLGCEVKRFSRRFENGFQIEPSEVERNVTLRTRLIVITNLHNPSGALTDRDTLTQLGAIAREANARVLVDEVYLEMLHVEKMGQPREAGDGDRLPVPHSFPLGPEFVVTTSLTKAYGLSGLRCGWILAEPDLAQRMWRLNDLFAATAAHPAERLSVIALRHIERLARRARDLLETNRPLLLQFLDSRDDIETVRPEFGTVVFPRLARGNVERLCFLLREKYEATVVPGIFFEMPDHFRLGIGCETETLAAGLDRLGTALDEVKRQPQSFIRLSE